MRIRTLEEQEKELEIIKNEQRESDLILELLEKQLLKRNVPSAIKDEPAKLITQLAIKNIEGHKIIAKMECIINNQKI